MGDLDAVVHGRVGVLGGGEHFLVKLLARAEAGVGDLDIDIRTEAGELYHTAGEGVDLDRAAHIEDEDAVRFRQDGCFHHEAAGLGDGHEEAVDIRVGDGDRAALLDLGAEARDDAAVRAEDIAETGGDEPGVAGDQSLLFGEAEGLDIDLGEALRAAHYVGRVHGLVGGDHHHLLDAVFNALVGDVAGAGDVHEHGFARVLLHQRDVLVRRGVEDDLRMILPEDAVQARKHSDVPDDGDEVQMREPLLQLQAEVVHRGLGIVKENHLPDFEARQLTDQLGANGTGCAGDEDDLVLEILADLVHVQLYLVAAEEVFDLQLADLALHRHPFLDFVDGRGDEDLDTVLVAEAYQSVGFLPGIPFVGEEDGGD